MKKVLLLFIIVLCFFSCKNGSVEEISTSYDYSLFSTRQIKSFALDSETLYNAFYLYPFEDKQGKEYLSFLNYRTNQLLFYDLNTCDFLFKIDLDKEGPNGISTASGYYIQDFDNMYVSSYIYSGLLKVDTLRRIVQRIPYGETQKGYKVVPSYVPSSHPYIPPILIGAKMYITQMAADHIYPSKATPITVAIDTISKQCEEMPLTYGDVLTQEQLSARETFFSRTFDGKNFIYSFFIEPSILVTSIDHKNVRRIKIKSKYIDDAPLYKISEDMRKGARLNLEVARYGDLIYDKYRNVYYRFAYPSVELDREMNWRGKAVYGRKKFSVIILDENFNIIGETLFPEGIYNSYVFFVHKDGLYISKDYQMNYDQSEDFMTFELFQLKKK